jgi:hypothetical protein
VAFTLPWDEKAAPRSLYDAGIAMKQQYGGRPLPPALDIKKRFPASPQAFDTFSEFRTDAQQKFGPNPGLSGDLLYPAGEPGGYDQGGYQGSYSLGMDPGYQAALNAEQLGLSQLDAQLLAARNRAVIEFGDPALAGLAGFGLDPQSADFAKQNYLSGNSTMSRLDKSRDEKKRAIINALAGRGILFSGETGYQEGEASGEYGRNVYDARNKVLDALRTVQEGYLDRKTALHDRVVQAMQQAYYFAMQNGQMFQGAGGGGGGGFSGGGGLENAGQFGGDANAINAAAARYAQGRSYNGSPYQPGQVMQEGHIETRNGVPGVYIKYRTGGGDSTEWTPIG